MAFESQPIIQSIYFQHVLLHWSTLEIYISIIYPKRQRNQELEAQNLEQQQQMAILHSEVERLRTDNVALYEKVRFLQSYSGQVRAFP